jgi:hypothetical protein
LALKSRAGLVLTTTIVAWLIATAAWAAGPGTPVVATKANEFDAAGSAAGYTSYSSNSLANPSLYNAYLLTPAKKRIKLNAAKTLGYAGGIDGSTVVYQQISGSNSDIKLYDTTSKVRSNPPSGVNTRAWEWDPTISGNYLLFGREPSSCSVNCQQVILFDTSTHTSTVVASVNFPASTKGVLFPGQVNGDYATWTFCHGKVWTCSTSVRQISTSTTTAIPNPTGKSDYYSGVTSDGTLYFAQGTPSSTGCFTGVKIIRDPSPYSSPVPIEALGKGIDIYVHIFAVTETDSSTSLYYDRQVCSGKYYSDIYKIANADTATPLP